jgi:hypothetical protein
MEQTGFDTESLTVSYEPCRDSRPTAGSSFDIQFPCQTFDSVTPVTNVTAATIIVTVGNVC